jgi:hypothetical protein
MFGTDPGSLKPYPLTINHGFEEKNFADRPVPQEVTNQGEFKIF